jgi:hypothetical protein
MLVRKSAVLLGVFILVACGPDEAARPAPPPPSAKFSATLAEERGALTISYRLRNTGDDRLVVYSGVTAGFDPPKVDAVYVTAVPDGVVQIAKRVFDAPAGVDENARALIRGEVLPPGREVTERLRVPLPLRASHPYGAGELPDPVRRVTFCVGAANQSELPETLRNGIPKPGSSPGLTAGRYGYYTHPSPQHLFCSQEYELGE